jgi:hypothetical protein
LAIWRGPGGSGDATADSANTAQVAETFATQAGVSAAAASSSANAASASASAASAAQTAAEAAQLAAETAETNAETAETNAETAQTAAEAAQLAAEAAQTAAELAETNAETAETNAEAAQTAAEAAQLAAENAQTAAELAETNAETAETNAVAAQLAAESARDSALAAYDNFDDRYLGAKTSDPTLDNDGDALVAGALYFNSVDGAMRVYTGSVWVDAYAAGTSFLAKANNLSDLPNVATARQNLDLEIGVDVQAFDATILKSADIGVTVQGYDADTAKYDDATANFTGTLQNGGSNVLVDTDIGSTVQAYDATIVVDADIGVTVQGYDADTVKYDDVNPTFTDTGAIKLPTGTELQRPGSPAAGQLRFNDDSDEFEGYDGTAWGAIGGGGVSLSSANTWTDTQTFEKPIIAPEIIYPSASFSWNSATSSPAKAYFNEPVKLIGAHRNMRRCVINDSGVVQYYLDENDSTKKADGTSATLTGGDGMVMVEIPKFYTKRVVSGTVTTWFVSDYALTGYTVHPAFVKDGVEVAKRYYSAYDACYLDATDSTYKSGLNLDDLTSSLDLANDKLSSVSGVYPIVGVTRAECRSLAANRGSGWRQLDFTLWSAVQLLYLTEHQSFYSQAILGDGNTNGSYLISSVTQSDSPHTIAGASNGWGNYSTNGSQPSAGAKPGTAFMVYRGIENLYGNCRNWADGINVNVTTNGNVHVTNNSADFADDTSTNMTLISTTAPTTTDYVSAIAAIDNYFIASSVSGGSSSTFLTDQWFGSTSSNRVVRVGGVASSGASAGAFDVSANADSSAAARSAGARLAF